MLETATLLTSRSSSDIGSLIISSSTGVLSFLPRAFPFDVPLTRFFWACLENKLMISADFPFSSVLAFFVGRARGLSGLVPGELVFCLPNLTGGFDKAGCDCDGCDW